jgi:hypothetical protein
MKVAEGFVTLRPRSQESRLLMVARVGRLDRGRPKGAAAGEGRADSACRGAATRSPVGSVICAAIATSISSFWAEIENSCRLFKAARGSPAPPT